MRRYEPQMEPVDRLEEYICDKCGKSVDNDMELQEAHSINFIGGYGSVFGDGYEIEADICQHCLKELIGDFCRTIN